MTNAEGYVRLNIFTYFFSKQTKMFSDANVFVVVVVTVVVIVVVVVVFGRFLTFQRCGLIVTPTLQLACKLVRLKIV